MINKITGFDDNNKSYAGWTCGWCPLQNDGSTSKPFRSTNATKALYMYQSSLDMISGHAEAIFQQQRVSSTKSYISPKLYQRSRGRVRRM
jgi:hypothetical protein